MSRSKIIPIPFTAAAENTTHFEVQHEGSAAKGKQIQQADMVRVAEGQGMTKSWIDKRVDDAAAPAPQMQ